MTRDSLQHALDAFGRSPGRGTDIYEMFEALVEEVEELRERVRKENEPCR